MEWILVQDLEKGDEVVFNKKIVTIKGILFNKKGKKYTVTFHNGKSIDVPYGVAFETA